MGISLHDTMEGKTSIFSIFCRFANPELASIEVDTSINKFSGKWNFHSSDELLIHGFDAWMKMLVPDRPITTYEEIEKLDGVAFDTHGKGLNRLIINNEIIESQRLMIDNAKTWDWPSGMAICLQGQTHRIMKKTTFQLWLRR